MSQARRAGLYGGLLLAAALAPSLWWIVADQTVWPWDQAMYGEEAVDLWYALIHQPSRYAGAFLHAGRVKPPAVIWLGQLFVPIGQAIGSIETGLLLGILLTQALALWVCYLTCLRLFPGRRAAALCGAALGAAAPIFTGMSHQFFAEPLQLLATAWVFWIAAGCERMRAEGIAAHMLLAGGLGLAAKTSTPVYCLLPASIAILELVRRIRSERSFRPSPAEGRLFAAGAILLALTAAWYGTNLAGVRHHVSAVMSAEVGYGKVEPFGVKLLSWIGATQRSFISMPLLLLLAAAVVVGALRSAAAQDDVGRIRRWLVLASIGHCAYALVIFSLNVVQETRFLAALLPAVTILTAWAASRLLRPGLILAGCIAQWVAVNAAACGFAPGWGGSGAWILPPGLERTAKMEAERIAAVTGDRDGSVSVIGVEYPWLNANSMAFFSAKARLSSGRRGLYTSIGYAAGDLVRALERVRDLQPDFVVSVEESAQPPPDFLNRLDVPVLTWMRRNPYYAPVPFESRLHVVIFQNRDRAPGRTE